MNASKPSGKIYSYNYDRDDPGWLGFQKVECQHCKGFSDYIKYDIIVLLLLAFYYTVARRQRRCLKDIEIPVKDKRALFWGITSEEADKSMIKGIGYLISHMFDFYGLEICWCMIAIAVSIRTDVYGVLYAIALGVFLLIPQTKLKIVWVLYVIVHGCLLLLQYAMLVNVPRGACIDDHVRDNNTLLWNNINPEGLHKWLWLPPIANNEYFILNKNWLWADMLIYVVVSAQLRNFKKTQVEEVDVPPGLFTDFVAFATSKKLADNIKRIMYKHFFWVALFVVLLAATIQVSLLGLLYLFASFTLLWRGRMLHYPITKLRRWWFLLLTVVWFVLLVKISLQLYTCVYFKDNIDNDCIVVRLFNAQCDAGSYYATKLCNKLPHHVGIWLDSFAFVIVTVQIVILSTHRFESVRAYLLSEERLKEAEHATSDLLEKINEEVEKMRIREKIIKENIKTRLLEVRTKYNTSVVEHYLRAGVKLPDHIEFNDEDPIELHPTTTQDLPTIGHDRASPLGDTDEHKDLDRHSDVVTLKDVSKHSDINVVRSKLSPNEDSEGINDEEKKSLFQGIWKLVGNGLSFIDSGLVLVINWLRNRSLYYRYLSKKRNARRKQAGLSPIPQIHQGVTGPVTTAEITLEATNELRINPCNSPSNTDKERTLSSPTGINDVNEIQTEEDGVLCTREDVARVWRRVVYRPIQFLIALYYATVANTEYICYFFIILNVINNGSLVSLVYAALMFLWGLLSVPWPTRRFWLTLMFYTMFVILVKYGVQFYVVNWIYDDFSFGVIVWDILLLISIFYHRNMLIVRVHIPHYYCF